MMCAHVCAKAQRLAQPTGCRTPAGRLLCRGGGSVRRTAISRLPAAAAAPRRPGCSCFWPHWRRFCTAPAATASKRCPGWGPATAGWKRRARRACGERRASGERRARGGRRAASTRTEWSKGLSTAAARRAAHRPGPPSRSFGAGRGPPCRFVAPCLQQERPILDGGSVQQFNAVATRTGSISSVSTSRGRSVDAAMTCVTRNSDSTYQPRCFV